MHGHMAFWGACAMIAMTSAFAVAGITQVNLERRMALDCLAVQEEFQVHFFGLILAASLFSVGIAAFLVNIFTQDHDHIVPNPALRETPIPLT